MRLEHKGYDNVGRGEIDFSFLKVGVQITLQVESVIRDRFYTFNGSRFFSSLFFFFLSTGCY